MVRLGIDFGSSNTAFAICKDGKPEAISAGESLGAVIPSEIAVVEGKKNTKKYYGISAKNRAGRDGVSIYNAFKMLLVADKQEIVKKYGYTKEYTPYMAASEFLQEELRQTLVNLGENKIDRLVVGAPDTWFDKTKTVDGRRQIREICKSLNHLKINEELGTLQMEEQNIQIVSEPAAACAYFAHNFSKTKGFHYNGTILLVDYGGGTLDISLAKIDTNEDNHMEIGIIDHDGEGENTDNTIGNAGIAYMQSVVKRAIIKAGLATENNFSYDHNFYAAVNAFEKELQDRGDEIEEVVEEVIEDLEYLENEEDPFVVLYYKHQEVEISYALLVETYDQIIRPTLHACLERMKEIMRKNRIDWRKRQQENFKIAIVGGFGNYYFVRRQVLIDTFQASIGDKIAENIIARKSDREMAIAYGTALIAEGIINIRKTAPYSIGIAVKNKSGEEQITYALTYKQEIEYDKPYFPYKEDGRYYIYFLKKGSIEYLNYNPKSTSANNMQLRMNEQFVEKLCGAIVNPYKMAVVGFSIDASEVVSIHIKEYDSEKHANGAAGNDMFSDETKCFELADFDELFDSQEIEL